MTTTSSSSPTTTTATATDTNEDTLFATPNTSRSCGGASIPSSPAKRGAWVGIDLGTTNCAASIYSIYHGRAKLLRLSVRDNGLARPPVHRGGKGGKIVPSAVLFLRGDLGAGDGGGEGEDGGTDGLGTSSKVLRGALSKVTRCDDIIIGGSSKSQHEHHDGGGGISVLVGHAAVEVMERSFAQSSDDDNNSSNDDKAGAAADAASEAELLSNAYVTSVKRVLGITREQAAAELVGGDDGDDGDEEEFVKSLPFRVEILSPGRKEGGDRSRDANSGKDGGEGKGKIDTEKDTEKEEEGVEEEEIEEGVSIKVNPFPLSSSSSSADITSKSELSVKPMQIAALLLRSIRIASERSIQKYGLHAPGLEDPAATTTASITPDVQVRNCVIGVPAHFGRTQRLAVQRAAKMAGFDGHVATITESTAAAMAYGVFVSPGTARNDDIDNATERGDADTGEITNAASSSDGKVILVFDMGGGTTDVTIATMSSASSDASDDDNVRFRVAATAGDRRLGGDDMDEALVRYVCNEFRLDVSKISSHRHRELRQKCRAAKEELCGNGDDPPPSPSVTVEHRGDKAQVTQEDFNRVIAPLVQRADDVIDETIEAYAKRINVPRRKIKMNEVVLVGGATRVPSVREMLSRKFPPPTPPELCYSIKPEAAVAQGAAVQAAILSGCVPKHELRSAMMLDALPHAMGVLVPSDGDSTDDVYIPILRKDMLLPAMDCATFYLANVDQPGVTIIAVEDVGIEFPLQRVGEFTFLLHKLTDEEKESLGGRRKIEVGFTVEQSGKFIVSIFDEHDPDHLEKKRRYLEEKRKAGELAGNMKIEALQSKGGKTSEEYFLSIAIILMLLMYVGVKIIFAVPPEESARIL